MHISDCCIDDGGHRLQHLLQVHNDFPNALYIYVKVNRPRRAHRESSGIALLILDLGARRGWVVSTTPRPLYPWERPGTICTGGWVGPRAGLDRCGKSRPHRDFFFGTIVDRF
jgi:hypothetical protein